LGEALPLSFYVYGGLDMMMVAWTYNGKLRHRTVDEGKTFEKIRRDANTDCLIRFTFDVILLRDYDEFKLQHSKPHTLPHSFSSIILSKRATPQSFFVLNTPACRARSKM